MRARVQHATKKTHLQAERARGREYILPSDEKYRLSDESRLDPHAEYSSINDAASVGHRSTDAGESSRIHTFASRERGDMSGYGYLEERDDDSVLLTASDPREGRHQREMIKVHGLWKKEKTKSETLEQELLELRERHAAEIDDWRRWQVLFLPQYNLACARAFQALGPSPRT